MLVADRMTSPPVGVTPDVTVSSIARVLEEHAISAVPVMEADRMVGIVSTSDVLRSFAAARDTPVNARAIMSTRVVVARPTERLDEAARRLVRERIHRLVVVDEGRPIGILAARDILLGLPHRRMTLPLRAVMTTPIQSIAIGDSVATGIAALAATNVHGLVVVEEEWPVGVLTHHEALAARALPPDMQKRAVEEIMSYETICLDVGTPIYRAVAHALAMDVRRFLVVEGRRLVGIVSCHDLVGALVRQAD